MSLIPLGLTVEVATLVGPTPTVFTTLALITNFQPPQATIEEIETTHMGSAGRRREFIAGLTDSGQVSGSMNWVPGSATDLFLEAWRNSGETRLVRATFPTSPQWRISFQGFLVNYAPQASDVGSLITASFAIRVSGAVTQASV